MRMMLLCLAISIPNKGKRRGRRQKKSKEGKPVDWGKPHTRKEKVGAEIGRVVGHFVGLPEVGATLGNLAHSAISKIFGKGDYALAPGSIAENSFIHPTRRESIPQFAMDNGYVRVAHREFLLDLETGLQPVGGQRDYDFVLHPMDARTFPWLSSLAVNFQQYKILGMVFEYRPTCGNAVSSTNSSMGSVNIVCHYDVNQRNFSTKKQVLNSFFATGCVPSSGMLHPIECANDQTPTKCLYMRSSPDPIDPVVTDARFHDHGRVQVFNTGSQARFICGELWVAYDILLVKPRLNPFIEHTLVIDYNGGSSAPEPFPEIHIPELQHLPHCCEEKKEAPDDGGSS